MFRDSLNEFVNISLEISYVKVIPILFKARVGENQIANRSHVA